MNETSKVRREFGNVYVTIFPDMVVPWKPLSIGDFIEYSESVDRGLIPLSILDDEIFKKCVVDKTLIRQFDYLPAGIVTTTVYCILQFSGPQQSIDDDLSVARNLIHSPVYSQFSQLINLITMVYQYTPSQLMDMRYEEFLKILALAEEKALQLGILSAPIQKPEKKKRRKFVKSPVLEVPPTHGIDFGKESRAIAATGNRESIDQQRLELIKQAKLLYPDLIK